MIALDTNVLVRFLVEDDAAQSSKAAKLVEAAIARDEELFVSDVVLCEVVWVLSLSYKVARRSIVDVLKQLLRAKHLRFVDSDLVGRAIAAFESSRGDFVDYMLREHARSAGCDSIATFDRVLLKEHGFISP